MWVEVWLAGKRLSVVSAGLLLVGCDPEYPEAYPEPARVSWARAPLAERADTLAANDEGNVFVMLDGHSVSLRDGSNGDEVWRTDLDTELCPSCKRGAGIPEPF